jgi:NAD(P)H-dependent FMN reductase
MRPGSTEPLYLDVDVMPITDGQDVTTEVAVAFVDVSRNQQVRAELGRANQELEDACRNCTPERGARNDERRAPVDDRGAGDYERGLQSTNENWKR